MFPITLRKIIYPRFTHAVNDIEKRRLSTLHRSILSSILISLSFLLLHATQGLSEYVLHILFITAIYCGCMWIYNYGKYDLSRNIFLISINAFVFSSCMKGGSASGIFFFYFPIAAGTSFLFNDHERKSLWFFTTIPVILFITSLLVLPEYADPLKLPHNFIKLNFLLCAAISISITLYCIYYYLKLYRKSTILIKSQKASLESLIDNIGDPVCQTDLQFNIIQYNDAFKQLMLLAFHTDIEKENNLQIILSALPSVPSNQKAWEKLFSHAFDGQKAETEMLIEIHQETRYYEVSLNPIKLSQLVCGTVITLKDITGRVNNEQLLKKNLAEKKKLSAVANTLQHSILITDSSFSITWSNPFFTESTGFTPQEISEKKADSVLNGNLCDSNKIEKLYHKLQSGKSASIETILYKKNKEPFWSYISSSPVFDESNNITSYIFIIIDITHRKRSEDQLQLLLTHSQKLNKELAERDTKLQTSIRKLNKQSWEIQISKQHLQKKKTELEISNAELDRKARKLEQINQEVIQQNKELEEARAAITQKAELLEQVSKYKSEFLANMSHELRTPLNSIIILSRLLAENKDGTLTRKQLEFASVVHKSGSDLLQIINDILDLSKIEAGKIEIEIESINLQEFCRDLWQSTNPAAKNKNIEFKITNALRGNLEIQSDPLRLTQILKNLLSNAIKFTPPEGKVELKISQTANNFIRFEVSDTGIGIPEDKQKLIFESFRQVDGSISRKYGGTGLGLSITRELIHLLSGRIMVSSREHNGSNFTIEIPFTETSLNDFHHSGRKLLIIEDDETFASILEKIAMREGFQTEICHRGDTGYMRIIDSKPDAILLDMNIPGINGWNLVKKVRSNQDVANIPIHIVSSSKATESITGLPFISWMEKPASAEKLSEIFRDLKNSLGSSHKVLVIEDSPEQGLVIKQMLSKQGVICNIAETGKSGKEQLYKDNYDCIILDLNLPDSDGLSLLKELKEQPEFSMIPVIVYSSRELNEKEKSMLRDYASSYINKNTEHFESLKEETSLFLQSIREQKNRKKLYEKMPEASGTLAGKKILVVDDDPRNIFALSSILELYGINIHTENNGQSAIEYLRKYPDTDLVLMDIMMPGMDGYQATKNIRNDLRLTSIPIIAVTAKAMKGDREKSLSNGLNEHISKPIEGPALIKMLTNFFQ